MHIGSGTDLEHLPQVCGAMERAAARSGPSLTTIIAGGGLPVPYRADDSVCRSRRVFPALGRRAEAARGRASAMPLRLEIEPGRYLVAERGFLLAEIRGGQAAGENVFYLVDAGFNNLARPILYGAYHPMSIVPGRPRRRPGPSSQRRSWAAPCVNRATSSRRRKGASSVRVRLPTAAWASCW